MAASTSPAPTERLTAVSGDSGRRAPRPGPAPALLGAGLLVAVTFAAVMDGATRLTDGSDLQIGLALLGLATLATLASRRGLQARALPKARAGIVLLALFGAWCALSISWSIAPDESWIEANRAFAYALVAGLALVLGASLARAPRRAAVAYVALASAVALYALGGKMLPWIHAGAFDLDHAGEVSRLRAPLGYWNALALFCVLAVPLALRLAGDRGRTPVRVGALLALPVLVTTVALTYSRGGLGAMVLATLVLIALGPDRLRSALLAGIALVGALPALLVAFLRDDLTTDGLPVAQRTDDGLLLLLALALGLVIALLLARRVWAAGDLRLSPSAQGMARRAALAAGGLLLVGLVALVASGWAGDQVEGFTDARASRDTDPTRIVATNSGNRWVWWNEAAGAAWDEPLFGYGAGSFPLVHRLYRSNPLDVRQPHSVPLEFLSETGIVGAALALGGLVLLALAGVGRLRGAVGADRGYAAALLAACAAWAAHLWVDWDWDIPAVTLPVMIFLGVLAARPPESPGRPASGRGPGLPALVAGGVLLALFAVSALLPALSRDLSDQALAVAARGGPENLREADEKAAAARRLDPFALEPVFTSADLARRRGDVERARQLLADAVRRQPDNSQTWFRLGQLQAALDDTPGALRSARTAAALDPFSPRFLVLALFVRYDESRSATATGTPLPERVPAPTAPLPPGTAAPAPAAPLPPGTTAPARSWAGARRSSSPRALGAPSTRCAKASWARSGRPPAARSRALRRVLGAVAGVAEAVERLHQVQHGHLLAAPDVERAAGGGIRGAQVGVHHVAHEHVVAGLQAVAEDRRRSALEQLAAEDGDHARLAERVLARPVDVAVAQRDRAEPVHAREQVAVALGAELRLAVGGLGRHRVVLGGGDAPPLAVDGAAGGGVHHAPGAASPRALQDVDRALHVHSRVERRVGHRAAHVDLRGQVEDHLGLGARAEVGHRVGVADVELGQLGALLQRHREVLAPAGGDVVEHGHLVAPGEQRVDQVGADEAGSAGDQRAHRRGTLERGPERVVALVGSPRCAACS
jgi:tetratricopeptide (TPR) repeat protein